MLENSSHSYPHPDSILIPLLLHLQQKNLWLSCFRFSESGFLSNIIWLPEGKHQDFNLIPQKEGGDHFFFHCFILQRPWDASEEEKTEEKEGRVEHKPDFSNSWLRKVFSFDTYHWLNSTIWWLESACLGRRRGSWKSRAQAHRLANDRQGYVPSLLGEPRSRGFWHKRAFCCH